MKLKRANPVQYDAPPVAGRITGGVTYWCNPNESRLTSHFKGGYMSRIKKLVQQHEDWKREIAKAAVNRIKNDPTVWDVKWNDAGDQFDVVVDGLNVFCVQDVGKTYETRLVNVIGTSQWVPISNIQFTPPQWVFDARGNND
jgi:hypothetical protein